MNGVNLLIDANAIRNIEGFIRKFKISDFSLTDDGFRISMTVGVWRVSIDQPEKFDRFVTCGFHLGSDCTFAADTVKEALESMCGRRAKEAGDEGRSELSLNSSYVNSIVMLMDSFFNELSAFPPDWFPLACEIERSNMRARVPRLAESEYVRKIRIWKELVHGFEA